MGTTKHEAVIIALRAAQNENRKNLEIARKAVTDQRAWLEQAEMAVKVYEEIDRDHADAIAVLERSSSNDLMVAG